MNRFKEFLARITKKGWAAIIGTAAISVLLIVGGIYYSKNPNAWPVSLFQKDDAEKVHVVKKDDKEDRKDDRAYGDEKDFVDTAVKTVFPTDSAPANNYAYDATGQTGYASWTQEVKIGLIIANEYDVKNVISGSCGDVYMVTYRVPGPLVLTNSVRALFGDKVFGDFLPGNIIPSYHPNLSFDSTVIENGTAKIYLKGTFSGSHEGLCDSKLALAQLSETAKAYPNVDKVEIYQNGELIHTSKE